MRARRNSPIEWVVDGKTGCWNCVSHATQAGYAIKGNSLPGASNRIHRFLYQELFGEIAEGNVIRHLCDNKRCINPEHLKEGSQAENILDTNRAKLTEDDALAIRQNANGLTRKEAALKYGVTPTTITHIRSNKTWKHLLGNRA